MGGKQYEKKGKRIKGYDDEGAGREKKERKQEEEKRGKK